MPFENFQKYVEDSFSNLKKRHSELSIETLTLMSPKQFIPKEKSNKGVLLIHGLLDTCASMSSLYDTFSNEGYFVNSILLPGHGTTPEDLLSITYHQWLQCVKLGLDDLHKHCDDITLVALSAGATLSLYLAEKYNDINRLVLFAPALELKPKAAVLIPTLHRFNQRVPLIAKNWLTFQKEEDKTKYQSITTNSVFQLMSLIELVNSANKNKIHCPIFMCVSMDDETISSSTAIKFFYKQPNLKNKLCIYTNDQNNTYNRLNTEIFTSQNLDEKILDYSHVCMHISPKHPLYGNSLTDQTVHLGAQTAKNKSKYKKNLKRLTYNPHYNVLIEKILTFIKAS